MAQMYPNHSPHPGPGRKAEGVLYDALRVQLPGDFHVFHGFSFVEEEEAREGEVDFLILHRELGLLGLECKGFGVKRGASGEWSRTVEGGGEQPLKRSPFEQAQANIHTLVRALEAKLFHQMSRGGPLPMAFGYAVAFPLTELAGGKLPLEAPRELVFDVRDMSRVGTRVQEAMEFWGRTREKGAPGLSDKEYERFRRHILLPKLKFVETPGAALAADEGALVQLTDEQTWIADALLENREFRVVGGAGTGKTVIALEVARRLAEGGAKTLVLCYNRALAGRMKGAVDSWGFEPGLVRATHFHKLCEEAFEALGEPFVEPPGDAERLTFYNHEGPDRLFRALDLGLLPRWDAVVVDEGQDFAASWWGLIESKVSDPSAGRHFVFYDPHQSLFGRECAVPPYPLLRLVTCVRSTRRITEYAATLGDANLRPHRRCPEGAPVEFIRAKPGEECRGAVIKVVQRLLKEEGVAPSQIAILSPHRLEHSSLAGVTELAGVPLKATQTGDGGAILHATISGFKGLEADAVVLIDADPADPRCDRSARYVAASRARHVLVVIGSCEK